MDKLIFILLIFIPFVHALAIDVYPDYNSTDCNHLMKTNATQNISKLLQLVTSDSTLVLREPGCYWLSDFFITENFVNITIIGYGSDANDYSIHCSETIGLAFAGVDNMQIKNVTIDGCGISSNNTDILGRRINETIDIFYKMSSVIGYAIVLSDCNNVVMENVVIQNTRGLGLVAINVGGVSTINNISFLGNWAPTCYFTKLDDVGSLKTIGGGMFVLYQDYVDHQKNISTVKLSIENVYAYNNSFCLSFTLSSVRFGISKTADKIGHVVGSASGVGITLGQLNYSVEVALTSSTFKNNTGWEARGVTIVTYSGVKDSKVVVDNCTFVRNGFSDYSYRPYGVITSHAALLVIKNAKILYKTYSEALNVGNPPQILISNSLFKENSAEYCGNIEILYFQPPFLFNSDSTVVFSDSTMTMNQGSIGPVLCSSIVDGVARFSDVTLELNNVIVHNNKVLSANGNVQVGLIDSSGQMLFVSMNVFFSGYTQFWENKGGAIIAVSSNIYMDGSVKFHTNSANFGGALQLLQESLIVLKNNTHLEVIENCALFKGGGIYFANFVSYASSSKSDCFLYFDYIDVLCNYSSCPDITQLNISVIFTNNTAAFGGTIFGSTLNDCPWYYDFKKKHSIAENCTTALQMLSVFIDNFTFHPELDSSSVVSTNAAKLSIKPMDDSSSNSEDDGILVFPGERLYYRTTALDSFNYLTSTLIISTSHNTTIVNSTLSDSVYWFVHSSDKNGSITPIEIFGIENASTTISIFSDNAPAITSLNVTLRQCGFGFRYDDKTKRCVCSVINRKVTCDIKNQTLTVGDNYWFGPVPQLNNLLVYQTCLYDVCKPGSKTFKPYNVDSQCSTGYKRRGLACGQCEQNLSAIFGSNRCRKCGNETLLLIPLFGVAGILVIIVIAFLDISVAEGYVNGFILYCNCLNSFLPYLSPTLPIDYVFILVSWINLDVGIQSCFYSGMTELSKIGLRYVFPAYLYLLMFFVVILARYSKRFARIPFSASRTFATLFLLTYFSIFGTSVCLLGYSRLEAKDEDSGDILTYYGWTVDISHPYGHGLHAPLLLIASLLMVTYILPIPLLLMFPSLVYRLPYAYKLKPILDAFWNPYKPSRRFWFGASSLFRITAFTMGTYVNYPVNVFWFLVIIILCLFIQERLSPYDGFLRSAFYSFFIFNLSMLLLSAVYYYSKHVEQGFDHYKIWVYVTVLSAYAAFGAIIFIHLFKRFKCIRKCVSRIQDCLKRKGKRATTLEELSDSDEETIQKIYPTPVTFTEFREPLLDGSINSSSYSSVN